MKKLVCLLGLLVITAQVKAENLGTTSMHIAEISLEDCQLGVLIEGMQYGRGASPARLPCAKTLFKGAKNVFVLGLVDYKKPDSDSNEPIVSLSGNELTATFFGRYSDGNNYNAVAEIARRGSPQLVVKVKYLQALN